MGLLGTLVEWTGPRRPGSKKRAIALVVSDRGSSLRKSGSWGILRLDDPKILWTNMMYWTPLNPDKHQ